MHASHQQDDSPGALFEEQAPAMEPCPSPEHPDQHWPPPTPSTIVSYWEVTPPQQTWSQQKAAHGSGNACLPIVVRAACLSCGALEHVQPLLASAFAYQGTL